MIQLFFIKQEIDISYESLQSKVVQLHSDFFAVILFLLTGLYLYSFILNSLIINLNLVNNIKINALIIDHACFHISTPQYMNLLMK